MQVEGARLGEKHEGCEEQVSSTSLHWIEFFSKP
jgi:hypothetical protein